MRSNATVAARPPGPRCTGRGTGPTALGVGRFGPVRPRPSRIGRWKPSALGVGEPAPCPIPVPPPSALGEVGAPHCPSTANSTIGTRSCNNARSAFFRPVPPGGVRNAKVGEMAAGDAKSGSYEAALDLMGRQGIAATSTREILAAAGIKNPSAISYHFGSKAGLVEELAGRDRERPVPDPRPADRARRRRPPPDRDRVGRAGHRHRDRRSSRPSAGCLLARCGGSSTATCSPQSLEHFVMVDNDARDRSGGRALAKAFPHLAAPGRRSRATSRCCAPSAGCSPAWPRSTCRTTRSS